MSSEQMNDAENIPKEELIHLCMKLNKRLQSVEAKSKENIKKKQILLNERNALLRLMERVIEVPQTSTVSNSGKSVTGEDDLDINIIEQRWNAWLAKSDGKADSLEQNGDLNDSDEKQSVNLQHESQLKVLEDRLVARQEEITSLQHCLEDLKQKSEEKIVYYQLQIQSLKSKEDTLIRDQQQEVNKLRIQLEEQGLKNNNNQETIVLLQEKLMELEMSNSEYRTQIRDLENKQSATALLRMEHDALVSSLRKDMKGLLDERDTLQKTIVTLKETISQHDQTQCRIQLLQQEALRHQVELEEKNAMIQRMRLEFTKNEDTYALKTALLATKEQELHQAQREIQSKEETINQLQAKIQQLQAEIEQLQVTHKEEIDTLSASKDQEIQDLTSTQQELLLEMHQLTNQHEETLEQSRRELASKVKMYTNLLEEKDNEIAQLASKISKLEEDIALGHPTERKILEIAMNQSRRDVFNEVSKGSRDIAMQKLQDTIANKDLELAENGQVISQLRKQINELQRGKLFHLTSSNSGKTGHTTNNSNINMDYLKNVVLQQSSEKVSLVSVLAMLLQFTPEELKEALKHTKQPVLDSRPVKEMTKKQSTNTHGNSISSDSFQNSPSTNSSYYGFLSFVSFSETSNESNISSTSTSTTASTPNNQSRGQLHGNVAISSNTSTFTNKTNQHINTNNGTTTNNSNPPSTPRQLNGRTLSAEERDFQEKLNKITGDILGLTSFDESDSGSYNLDYK